MTRYVFLGVCLGVLTGCQKSSDLPASGAPPPRDAAAPVEEAAAPEEETVYEGKMPSQWIKDLEDPDPSVRGQAANTITAIAGLDAPELGLHGLSARQKKAAVPKLMAMLKETDASNRGYAAQALTVIGRPEAEAAIPALKEAQDDPDEFARRLIREALDELQASDPQGEQPEQRP